MTHCETQDVVHSEGQLVIWRSDTLDRYPLTGRFRNQPIIVDKIKFVAFRVKAACYWPKPNVLAA